MKAIRNNIIETGIVETLQILQKYGSNQDIVSDCSVFCPVPEINSDFEIDEIVDSLWSTNKEKLLLLTPEIAVISALAKKSPCPKIIVSLPNGLETEVIESITNNLPEGIDVSFISENDSPANFTNKNAAIVAFGFADGDRALILNYNYRMMEHYKSFYGQRILVSCAAHMSGARPIGWAPISTHDFFNAIV